MISRRRTTPRRMVPVLALLLLGTLAGCVSTVGNAGQSLPSAAAAPAAAPVTVGRTNCVQSKDPLANTPTSAVASISPGANPANGPTAQAIRKRGFLVVGTSGDVPLWGQRGTDGLLRGFDIQLSQQIAQAIFGSTDYSRFLRFRTINYAQRIPYLQASKDLSKTNWADIVAHTMTINCTRWSQIDFSTAYYQAGQRLLVRTDDTRLKSIKNAAQLAQLGPSTDICVAAGTTNLQQIKTAAPRARLTTVSDLGDCLVQFEQGRVDAITGDDAVLAGFVTQDPRYATLAGPTFSTEPYGIGVSAQQPDLTRFVNSVLETLRADGELQRIYADTLGTAAGQSKSIPLKQPVYGRTRS